MKRILLLATGGTIASRAGQDGLEPQPAPPELLHALDELSVYYNLTYRALMSLDSSNIQAEEWQQIARSVYDALPEYDGVVITHGTDTMAYTASMLSFMLQNLNKGVILTGCRCRTPGLIWRRRSPRLTAVCAACISPLIIKLSVDAGLSKCAQWGLTHLKASTAPTVAKYFQTVCGCITGAAGHPGRFACVTRCATTFFCSN